MRHGEGRKERGGADGTCVEEVQQGLSGGEEEEGRNDAGAWSDRVEGEMRTGNGETRKELKRDVAWQVNPYKEKLVWLLSRRATEEARESLLELEGGKGKQLRQVEAGEQEGT